MIFNNIIYFIIVLLIFTINYPEKAPKDSLLFSLTMLFFTWLIFAGFCRWGFRDLKKRLGYEGAGFGKVTAKYHQLIARLSILSIFLFALAVYLFNLKYWLQMIPGVERLSALQGILALSLFFLYLSTIWYYAYQVYQVIFRPGITRRSFIRSNIKINLPILFPWIVLSLVYDFIDLSPWAGTNGFLNSVEGHIIFFAGFIFILITYMPWIIKYWWGCKPFKDSEKAKQLTAFLHEKGFKYRDLLTWPIFEGRMMTAGIMGFVPRYRYILVTDSLFQILSIEELKAVLAHEMGHAKYRHLLFYVLLFVGFMVIYFGLQDFLTLMFYMHPFLLKMTSGEDPQGINLFYLTLSIPMVMTLVVYLRFVMGFFMRNFERQADLYSAVTMGTPKAIISSLEKIALLSGKSRNLPSWHHFSIKERVDFLRRTLEEPGLVRRHNRFVAASFLIYLLCLVGLGYVLNFSQMKQHMVYTLAGEAIKQQLSKNPDKIELLYKLATVYDMTKEYEKAIELYEKIIRLDSNHATALNNLAWLLVTVPDQGLKDNVRALDLAKKAVAIERSAIILDTLAEAYYVNGMISEAVETIEEAISIATDNRDYYEDQLKKFRNSLP